MNRLLFLYFTLFSIQVLGCHCSFSTLIENYQRSDFVAVVKILKVTPDPKNGTYHTVEVETLNRYKGAATTLLRINTYAHTSCAFSIPKNTTWLVFASMGDNGVPGFGACSGSQQLHHMVDTGKRLTAVEHYGEPVDLQLEALSYLKEYGLVEVNSYNLNLVDLKLNKSIMFKGFENQNQFAVYELDVNEDLSIGKITSLRSFDNPELAQLFTRYLQKNARINPTTRKGIPTKTKLIVLFQYYSTKGKAASLMNQL
jgi:hypothetical protein